MRVKLNKAVKIFFGSSSLEQVYLEAISNALDANATSIRIDIQAEDVSRVETLAIQISDNGEGFTDERFRKFSHLFDVEESSHKGLGRLVYLLYFEKTLITSYYDETHFREFVFSDSFDESSDDKVVAAHESGTTLQMSGYLLDKVAKVSYLQADSVLKSIEENFYSRLYKYHLNSKQVEIHIYSKLGKDSREAHFSTLSMPDLSSFVLPEKPSLFQDYEMYYSIEKVKSVIPSVITAISIDDRTYQWDIIANENLPANYKMIFLLYSSFFTGKSDAARMKDTFSQTERETIKRVFKNAISSLLNEKVPKVAKKNRTRQQHILDNYPHLMGYIDKQDIGLSSVSDLVKNAQDKYFQDQREVLGATSLDDGKFEKSLALTSLSLAEYVLFRQKIIERLRQMDKDNLETEIHNLIVPRYNVFTKNDFEKDLYRNNIWVLDDKFMTYSTVLSEEKMTDLIQVITDGEVIDEDEGRPDIAVVFSGNPESEGKKVDVVIVELKRKGIGDESNSIVETQLEKRARKLYKYYNSRIQRIWYYGIVDFDEDYALHLESNEYAPLFSNGKAYYREKQVVVTREPRVTVPAGIFIMDLDAVIKDADTRNATFLNILRSGMQNDS